VSALRLTRSYHFSAGHRLASPALSDAENTRVYGQCYRQHGHNYRVEVTLAGRPDPTTGMAADLGADSLAYLSMQGLVRATGIPKDDLCLACINSDYPTEWGRQRYRKSLEVAGLA